MATELFKETLNNLVDDYCDLRKNFLEKVESGDVRLKDIEDFNFHQYVEAYLGFITVESSAELYDDEEDFDLEDEDLEE